jgi:hypothetical protein
MNFNIILAVKLNCRTTTVVRTVDAIHLCLKNTSGKQRCFS